MRLATRAAFIALALALTALAPATSRPQPKGNGDAALARQLSTFLEGGADRSGLGPSHPLAPLERYPLLVTTAYLLMQDDPVALRRHYPVLLREVNDLFSTDNLTDGGLVRGMPGSPEEAGLSPAFEVFANLELWSIHLVAWKIGAYEDALDYLAWSRRFSETVTRSFYSPTRGEFFPISAGLFAAGGTPADLLPLVLDRTLGPEASDRVFDRTIGRYAVAPPGASRAEAGGGWRDPAARPVILDLLAIRLDGDLEKVAALERAARDTAAVPPDAWSAFWGRRPASRGALMPPWAPISTLANLTLLLERESLALPSEIEALRASIDTIDAALTDSPIDLETHASAIAAINRLMARLGRFASYVTSPKERWRVAEEAKWVRVSPRIKRLVNEGCAAAAVDDLASVKALLTERIGKAGVVTFSFDLPEEPLAAGDPVPFTAIVASRDPIAVTQVYLHVGKDRWNVGAPSGSPRISTTTPLRYQGSFSLPPDAPPGIAQVTAHIDFLSEGRRVELWRHASVGVATPHQASIDLPAGRRIELSPVPIAISIRYRTERDVQGEIEGSFLREIVTEPPLPAKFLVKAGAERTSLTLTAAPRARLAPGSYPFSLVVSVGRGAIASFADSLIHPFRWMHLGPFPPSNDPLKDGVKYQADLYKRYSSSDGSEIGWREVPGGSIDVEGALRPERLYESDAAACALFYTMVDSPARLKVRWSLATADAAALWINGLPVLPAVPGGSGRIDGEAELRQGPNSFLLATRWERVPAPIRFEIRDENGLPPAGLNNELSEIIDGWERIVAPPAEPRETAATPARMLPVSFSFDNRSVREVSLIGSFNNWDPAVTPMKRDENGLWRASLMLKPGRYTYKFFVDRTRKIVDPRNPVSEPDGFGGSSSVIEVK